MKGAVPPLVMVAVAVPLHRELQLALVGLILTEGGVFTFTVAVAVSVHPFPSVTVTV